MGSPGPGPVMNRDEVDHALARLGAEWEAIEASLLSLQDHAGRRLLEGAELTGSTKHRWATAEHTISLLWTQFEAYAKALNDARGHQTGDAVLRDVADILRRSIRSFDVCARYGGEEFAILMPGASTTTAYQIAERIRRHTESHFSDNWRYAAGVRPTLSIGVSNATGETSGAALVATADAALLWAKAAGKNVVKLHADMPARPVSG